MSISGTFLWRFLDDVWDLLPTEDRKLFETYWSAKIQVAANLEQKVIEATLSTEVDRVPTFLTERWERFIMDEATVDLLQESESITLTGIAPSSVARESAFFDTLQVTNTQGAIPYEESVTFFDQSVRTLRYGKILRGTISVKLGLTELAPNRDYSINLVNGTIQALENGRIPIDEPVVIRYSHEAYTLDLDYTVDEAGKTIQRLVSSAITSGESVLARYGYNATPTLSMVGSTGSASGFTLTDPKADFTTLIPGRTLTITDGVLAGSYPIAGVAGSTSLTIAGTFPDVQLSSVKWTIDAFPYAMRIDQAIRSIPYLRNLVDSPDVIYVGNRDYRVSSGILSSRSPFPFSEIGPENIRRRQMWAETTLYNRQTPYRNFGVLIEFFRRNSDEYKLALQGLWYTFWTGSTPGNFQRGLQILLGLPFARRAGTVTVVDTDAMFIQITDSRGQILTYSIPTELNPAVAVGDEVERFDVLTTGISVIDSVNTPGFVTSVVGRAAISRYLTDDASRGVGDTDETKALTLLENHLFVPFILQEAILQTVNVEEITTYLENLKPAYTDYIFSFGVFEEDDFVVGEDDIEFPVDFEMDLTATVNFNDWNTTLAQGFYVAQLDAEIIAGGTQATGNFRDGNVDFGSLGIDEGDYVYILNTSFKGIHRVLSQISSDTLSLDIPDAEIVGTPLVQYGVVTEEASLDNDAINFARENIILPGSSFSVPTTYNTATDADFASTSLNSIELLALLLINPGAATDPELVQEITDGNVDLGELSVSSPPGVGVQVHEVASCALKRVQTGPPSLDAYAI